MLNSSMKPIQYYAYLLACFRIVVCSLRYDTLGTTNNL